jgi:hypothetical protein
MGNLDQHRFAEEVVEAAYQIELMDALGGAREAQSFPTGRDESASLFPEEIARAKAHAEELIKQHPVLDRLCPAMKSVSGDLAEVAKTVAAAMLPLSLGPQAILPLTPLVFGALAVVVFRVGVRTVCPEGKGTD